MTVDRFIFDVDGTLTPSRGKINPEFKEFFNAFCRQHPVYLVTGSDKPKTVEQIGEDTYNLAHTVFNCSGNDIWQSTKHIRTTDWLISEIAQDWLSEQLTDSKFPLRTGLHFEHRPGMMNFSVVGRNADATQRKQYVEWDQKTNERNIISEKFNKLFPELDARPGGETGIDIAPKGADKSAILDCFDLVHQYSYNESDTLYFYGDRMDLAGNDYPLKKRIIDNDLGYCYNVDNWKQTWELLNEYSRNDRSGDTGHNA